MVDLSFYKPALEKLLYRGVCTIQIRKSVKDDKTKKAKNEIETLYEDVPCLLSHSSDNTGKTDVPRAEQNIELFINPNIIIPPNSKIIVTQDNVEECYGLSGVANRYPGHQEIHLEKWEKWA